MDIKKSIVAILNDKNKIIGTGFLVSGNLILTCAHVVEAMNVIRNERVTIRFSDHSHTDAKINTSAFSPSDEKDVAVLYVDTVPDGITPLPLGNAAGSANHDFYSFGYAIVTDIQGIGARGKIVDIVEDGTQVQLTSQEPDHGMSGGPVLDEQRRVVIGMVTKGKGKVDKNENIRNSFTTFATSIEVIRQVCSALQLTQICPYRSLDVFTEADAGFFFGRDRIIGNFIERLKHSPRFLAVLGPSGSGKSSAVQAGLIPALRKGKISGSQKWDILVSRPADQPFEQLEIAGLLNPQAGLESAVMVWLKNHPNATRLVLVIDQFEEVLVSTPVDIRQKFITELGLLLNSSAPITLVLTLRDDFYSRFLKEASSLSALLEHGLVNMSSELEQNELRAMIFEPAKAAGLTFDEGLIDDIIADACEVDGIKGPARSTILPLLEFSLTQVWELRKDERLTHDAYKEIGGTTGGLSQWADKTFYDLSLEERNIAEQIFCSLIHLGDKKEQIPDTRRIIPIEQLATIIKRDDVKQVVDKLVQARLLSIHRKHETDQQFVEIIHDALLREWGLLEKWIIDYRNREQRLRERRRKITIFGLGLGLLVMIILAAVAWNQKNYAVSQQQTAQANEAEAIRQTNIAKSLAYSAYAQNALSKNDQELALAFAVEAVKIKDPPEQAKTILSQIAFGPGTRRIISGIPSNDVFRVAVSADGNLLLSVSGDGDIQLWDALTGQEVRRIGDHGTYDTFDPLVPGITFAPSDHTAISAGGEDVRFWDVQTGELIRKISFGKNRGFNTAQFSTDSKYMLWGSTDGSVHFLNLDSGTESIVLKGKHNGAVQDVAINKKNTLALSGGADGRVILWNLETGEIIREFTLQVSSFPGENIAYSFRAVSFSPDEKSIVGGTYGGAIEFWDINTGELIHRIDAANLISAITFSPDGNSIAFGTQSSVEIWDVEHGQQIYVLTGHSGWIQDVKFSPNGKKIISASLDGTIRLWDLTSDVNLEFRGHTASISQLSTSADGKYLLSSSWDGSTRAWDVINGREIKRIKTMDDDRISSVGISQNGEILATGNKRGITLSRFDTGEIIHHIDDIQAPAAGLLAFSPTENLLFVSDTYFIEATNYIGYDSSIHALDIESGQEKYRLFNRGISEFILSMVVSPDGKVIVSSNQIPAYLNPTDQSSGRINVWSTTTQRKLREILIDSATGMVVSLAISADSKYIYAGTMSGKILIYDLSNGDLKNSIPAHLSTVLSLATNNDGTLLASSADDKTVRLWNTKTWTEVSTYEMTQPVKPLIFSGDGSKLFGGTSVGIIYSWLIAPHIEDTLTWIGQNRYLRPFSCSEREQYALPVKCDSQGNIPLDTTAVASNVATPYPSVTKQSINQTQQNIEQSFVASTQVSGNLSGRPVTWAFDAQGGDIVNIVMESGQFDSYLVLKNSEGTLLAANDDFEPGFSNNAAIKSFTIPKTGTYFALADCFLNDDFAAKDKEYHLTISVMSAKTDPQVKLSVAPSGKFGFGWNFDKNNQPEISDTIENSPSYSAGLRPGDIILMLNGMQTSEMSARQIWDILRGPEGNKVTAVVLHISGQSQTIYMVSGPPAQGDTVGGLKILQPGKKIADTLAPNEKKSYVFQGQANNKIAILMGGSMDIFSGKMQVIGPDQSILANASGLDNNIGYLVIDGNVFMPMIEPKANGTYTVTTSVTGVTSKTYGYTISIQNLLEKRKLKPIDTIEDKLSATDGYYWTFDAKKGQFIKLNLALKDSQIEPLFILLAPDGSIMGANGLDGFDKYSHQYNMDKLPDVFNDGAFPILTDGEYTIILLPYLRENLVQKIGSFNLSFEIGAPKIEQELTLNQVISSVLDKNETKIYAYKGTKGEKIRITLKASQPASDAKTYFEAVDKGLLDTALYIVSDNMIPIGANKDFGDTSNSQVEVILPTSGTYYIFATSETGSGADSFTINIENVP